MLMRRGLMDKRMGLGFLAESAAVIAAGGTAVGVAGDAVNKAGEAWDVVAGWFDGGPEAATCTASGRRLPSGAFERYECTKDGTTYTCPPGFQPVRTSVLHRAPKARLQAGPKSIAGRTCMKVGLPTQCPPPGTRERSRIFHPSPKARLLGSGRPDGGVIRDGRVCLTIVRPTVISRNGQQVSTAPAMAADTAGVSGDSVLPALALGAAILYFATKK